MDTPMTQYQFRAGDDVIAADGDKVGNLADVYGTYLVVEKGFFFPRDYYIPFSTVANYDPGDGKIYLSNEDGEILVVRAGSTFEHLATSSMNELLMATPALSRGVMYVRGAASLFAIRSGSVSAR